MSTSTSTSSSPSPSPSSSSSSSLSSAPSTQRPPVAPAAPVGTTTLSGPGLFTVLLGAALPLIDFFIVNVALPTIDRDLSASEPVLELVVAGYGIAYAVLLVLGGRLGDLLGRRRLFLGGMAAFGLTSLACGLAPTAWTLVAARVAQGAAAAAMLPQVLATVQATTTGRHRARAMSMYGATAGLSMVTGQVLGGVLVSADVLGTGWRSVFLVNVPVVVLALILTGRTVPETRSPRPEPVDGPGTVLLTLALLALLAPLTEGRSAGWPLWTWLSLAAFVPLSYAFYAVERRADRAGRTPLVPPSLFRLTSLRRGIVMVLPFSVGFSGFMFVIAVALQQGEGQSATRAGLALAPMALVFFAVSLAGPRLVARWGTRVITVGGLAQAAGVALIALAAWRTWPDLGTVQLLPGAALAGAGQALQLPILFRVILSEVPAQRAGVGGGVMTTAQQAALALGVATLGSLFLSLVPGMGMRDALVATLLAQLAAVALTVGLSLRLPRTVK
ncbi:MFS transporter [Streptomyces beihaiensis]|uniref:MFS transporter n=1 Tax=Streptomyces beihaiensis TaxID=2984495 RepID=A0ABT3TPD6_9ACTN|nr:MFS transporter [Streptomyces beihaiensis]MCX3058635.1 MFS transporter [Streptomyces beihaiensis]